MANTRKKRARSAHAHTIPQQPPPNGTTKGVQTPGGPTAQENYSVYRTLKLCQLIMQATEKFLQRFSPFMSDEVGTQAEDLHADLKKQLPRVNAHVEVMEAGPHAESAGDRGEGGEA